MIITKRDKIIFFLREYYLYNGIFVSIIRVLCPFTLFAFGIKAIDSNEKIQIAFGGFCIMFSIYFLIRPYLYIYLDWGKYQTKNLDIQFLDDKIIIKDDLSYSELNYKKLYSIQKRKTYIKFSIEKRQAIYIPYKNLKIEEINLINDIIDKSKTDSH